MLFSNLVYIKCSVGCAAICLTFAKFIHLDGGQLKSTAPPPVHQTPFTLAARRMPSDKVKGLHSFATVESPWFREMTKALNPHYTPPGRTVLSNTLIPAWYEVERQNVITELANVGKVTITSDGWTSLAQDHYITVPAHYSSQGKLHQKVLRTKAVFQAQTGETVAVEIGEVLEEFGIAPKVVVMTVDNASNMNVAAKRLNILKLGCFAHTLNLAAQKVYSIATVTRWAAKLRVVIVWMKLSTMSSTVLKRSSSSSNFLSTPCYWMSKPGGTLSF